MIRIGSCLLIFFCLFQPTTSAQARDIVVIGDSLSCGSFGRYFVAGLRTNKENSVSLFCAVSSVPSHWLNGKNPAGQKCQTMSSRSASLAACDNRGRLPMLSSILAAHKRADFIISLGTNSLLSQRPDVSYGQMASMIRSHGRSCTWIGPPHLNPSQSRGFPIGRIAAEESNLNGFYFALASKVGGECDLIDSRIWTGVGSPGNQTVDGVHRTDSAGRSWAQSIVGLLQPL